MIYTGQMTNSDLSITWSMTMSKLEEEVLLNSDIKVDEHSSTTSNSGSDSDGEMMM